MKNEELIKNLLFNYESVALQDKDDNEIEEFTFLGTTYYIEKKDYKNVCKIIDCLKGVE
jgi:hypothetical protein